MPALSSYTWNDRLGRRSLSVIWVTPLRTSLTTELSVNHSSLSPSFSTLPSFSNGFNLRSNSRWRFAAGLPGGRRCGCLSTSAGGARSVRASSSTVDIPASSRISTSPSSITGAASSAPGITPESSAVGTALALPVEMHFCLSVCLSGCVVLCKIMKIRSRGLHRQLQKSLYLLDHVYELTRFYWLTNLTIICRTLILNLVY